MFNYIKGIVTGTFQNGIVLENSGIGFELNVPANSALYLVPAGEQVTVYTCMAVREDDISLYGFDTREELDMFKMLTTVSGIGNRGAIAVLSALSVGEIRKAILLDDPDTLAKAQGIGKKTAQKIVIELKDKIGRISAEEAENAPVSGAAGGNRIKDSALSAVDDAIAALMALGYSKSEAAESVAAVGSKANTAEDYIKFALKNLQKI